MSPLVLWAKLFALRFEHRADIYTFIGVRITYMNIIVTARSVPPGARRPVLTWCWSLSHAFCRSVFLWCLRCRIFFYLVTLEGVERVFVSTFSGFSGFPNYFLTILIHVPKAPGTCTRPFWQARARVYRWPPSATEAAKAHAPPWLHVFAMTAIVTCTFVFRICCAQECRNRTLAGGIWPNMGISYWKTF